MPLVIRVLLLAEAATFIIAAMIHGGLLISGYEHREARIAESIIAAVLLAGAAVAWIRPGWTRRAGLFAALFWTLVGIGTIVAGIGPRTPMDVAYHMAIVAVLAWGFVTAWRAPVRQV